MPEHMDLYRPDKPHHMKNKTIMVTREMRDQMKILRQIEHLSWAQIGQRMGHSTKWAHETGKSLGLPMRGICKHAGHRESKIHDKISAWIRDKAGAGEVVGKYLSIAAAIGVSVSSVKRTVRLMKARGEITHERLGQGRNLFRLVSHGP